MIRTLVLSLTIVACSKFADPKSEQKSVVAASGSAVGVDL